MTSDWRSLAGLDRVIHEPARLLIITMLYPVASMDFLRLNKVLGYTQGNLSSHLAKLEAAGYVALDKKFKGKYPMTVCSLTKKGRAALANYAEKLKSVSKATDDLLENKA
jgi:DNA-binding MarR family transcriptional regulator